MKSIIFLTLLGLILYAALAAADCTNAAGADDGEVAAWFKNLGCKVVEGAKDLKDAAKPYTDKVVEGATNLKDAAKPYAEKVGNTVSETYDNLKKKLSDEKVEATSATPLIIEPTEKIPLAPLSSGPPSANVPASAIGEQKTDEAGVTPESIDNRFLFQTHECPRGQVLDHHNKCRPQV